MADMGDRVDPLPRFAAQTAEALGGEFGAPPQDQRIVPDLYREPVSGFDPQGLTRFAWY